MAAISRPAARVDARARRVFLDQLAETSNVAASARAAGVTATAVYALRRRSPEFRAAWQAALAEGYARLEAAMLAEALIAANGKVSDTTLKSRAQKYRLGLTLLSAHRATVRGAPTAAPEARSSSAKERLAARIDAMADRIADGGDAA